MGNFFSNDLDFGFNAGSVANSISMSGMNMGSSSSSSSSNNRRGNNNKGNSSTSNAVTNAAIAGGRRSRHGRRHSRKIRRH